MLDKDKLWIAIYIDVTGLKSKAIETLGNDLINSFNFDESVKYFIIPHKGKSSFEVIYNPYKDDPDNYKVFFESINKNLDIINNTIYSSIKDDETVYFNALEEISNLINEWKTKQF